MVHQAGPIVDGFYNLGYESGIRMLTELYERP